MMFFIFKKESIIKFMEKNLYNILKDFERNNKNIAEDSRSSDWLFLSNLDKFDNCLVIGSYYGKNFENLKNVANNIDLILYPYQNEENINLKNNSIDIIETEDLKEHKYRYDLIYIDDFNHYIKYFFNNKNILNAIKNSNELIYKNKFRLINILDIIKSSNFKKNNKFKLTATYNYFPKNPVPLFICEKYSSKANKFLLNKILYIIKNLSYETKKRNMHYYLIGNILIFLSKFLPIYIFFKFFYYNNYQIYLNDKK